MGEEGAIDVEIEAADSDTVGQILPALATSLRVPVEGLWEHSSRLPDHLPLTARPLAHGAVLGLGRPAPVPWRSAWTSAVELQVIGGPDAGRTFPLGQGRHVLGRGHEATLPLRDPDLSRRHLTVHVGGGRITVADSGSTNGSCIEDEALGTAPRPWPVGAVVRAGTTALTVASPVHGAASVTPGRGGRFVLRPTPRHPLPAADVEVTFPRAPATPAPRRLAWVAVALPAVGGVLMAWLLSTPTFLFFALLSPVVAVGTWLSDRWTGRRSGRRATIEHAGQVIEAEARVAAAVREARRAAELAQPDLATLTTAARRRTGLLWSRAAADADAATVRLGVGRGRSGVVRVDGDGTRDAVEAEHLPAVVDLRRDGGLAVVGPRELTDGVLASVITQLTALHPPGAVELHLLVDAARLPAWQWVRWLPHLPPSGVHVHPPGAAGGESDGRLAAACSDLVARRLGASVSLRPGAAVAPSCWTVVVVDRLTNSRLAAVLSEARDVGVLILTAATSLAGVPVPVPASLHCAGETGDTGILRRRGAADQPVQSLDRLPPATAARFARDLAGLAPADASGAVPRSVRLLDLPDQGLGIDDTGAIAGQWLPGRRRLRATLGCTADGPVVIDLCSDGPHALVAGTTGSGKSELLQTLVTSLALNHPPATCSFLLIDYKGGAAFAEAAALPHTVGVLTDLDTQTTARALRSLDAELVRRESVLADAHVADVADLPDAVDLSRVVIVVDEFATLAEELPSFVPGLVSIAQRGRSLGVHLVLATQRPGGVVSPEIRANSSLRLCLRTIDESDSRDVMGSPSAAHLPVDVPGRAYLRTGNGAPRLFQVARVASADAPSADLVPAVRRWNWPAIPTGPARASAARSDLSRLSRAIAAHARASGARLPHRPWCPPLPDHLAPDDLPDGPHPRTRLPIGLLDLPDEQSQRALEIDLAEGGTCLAVGGPRSGRTTLLRTVLREAVSRLGPDELHVHVIESGSGSLGDDAKPLEHTGTVTDLDDRLRTVRLIHRLAEEIAARRATPDTTERPALLLLIDGLEELTALAEDADPGTGSTTLSRLLRDGAAAGLTCVATADRAIPGGRLAALARRRLVLPLADRADYAVAGVAPRAVPERRPPGRALYGEDALECQIAAPRDRWTPAPARTTARQRPLRIPRLPADPVLPATLEEPVHDGPRGRLCLVVGPGGDHGRPLHVDLTRGGGLLVAGPPGSGRTTTLDALAGQVRDQGIPLLRLDHRGTPRSPERDTAGEAWITPTDEAAARAWIDSLGEEPGVVVADDVGSPAEAAALNAVTAAAHAHGRAQRIAFLAAAQPALLATHYHGPLAALRRARTGLLLCPGPGDADLLGIRLPRTPVPVRPGSGWLVTSGTVERVQVARRREGGMPP